MNTIMLKNKAFLVVVALTLAVFERHITCNAQSNFKDKTKSISVLNFKKIEPEVIQGSSIAFSDLEKDFLQYEKKDEMKAREVVFYYLKNSKKGYDGLYGTNTDVEVRNVDNSSTNFKLTKVRYDNKISLFGQIKLLQSFITIVVRYETYDRVSAFIYNYNQDGLLLSVMQILDNEKDGPKKVGKHSVISSTINQDGTIDIVTDADFRIDRKIKLDPDGHFRIIEEKVTRYDDN